MCGLRYMYTPHTYVGHLALQLGDGVHHHSTGQLYSQDRQFFLLLLLLLPHPWFGSVLRLMRVGRILICDRIANEDSLLLLLLLLLLGC